MTRLNYINLEKIYNSSNDFERILLIERVKQSIVRKNNHITQMMNIVESKVKHYKSDFYIHDMQLFHTYDVSFLWVVRESGTHWINIENQMVLDNGESGNLSYLKAIMKLPRVRAVYHYDKSTHLLQKINLEKAISLVSHTSELVLS